MEEEIRQAILGKLSGLSGDSLQLVLSTVNRELSGAAEICASKRYNLFPIQDHVSFKFADKQISYFWTAGEHEDNLQEDGNLYDNLDNARIKTLVRDILGFLVSADGMVTRNVNRFSLECKTYEEGFFYQVQAFFEAVHALVYNLAADRILRNDPLKADVFEMIDSLECMIIKKNFMEKYINSDLPLRVRYAAAAATEGIFFMGLFAIILYLASKNYFPGFIAINDLVRRDETLHRDFFCYKARSTLEPEDHDLVKQIFAEAVDAESGFVNYLLSTPLISAEVDAIEVIRPSDIVAYLKMLADESLEAMGISNLYGEEIFIPYIPSTSKKGNFYERLSTQYQATTKSGPKKVRGKLCTF
jgi:ribonucleotide reductase beta subunit family protein with ferritin-like domain